MTDKCFLLFKAQLLNQFKGRSRTKSTGKVLVLIAISVVAVILVLYTFSLSFGLGAMGMPHLIPSYAIAITGLLTLFFTALKANGVLFAYPEYDILMSFPVKTSTIIASRFMTMYAMNLAMTAFIMIPMGIPYIIWGSPGILFYPVWILGIFVQPLIPTTLATLLGALIIFIASRFQYARAMTTILSLTAMVLVLTLSMGMSGMDGEEFAIEQMRSIGSTLLGQIHKGYPPAILFYQAVVKQNYLAFFCFAAGSLLWYYVFIKVISLRYKSMNTGLLTYHARSDYRLTTLAMSSPLKALWKKEIKRFFGSTVYCLNMGMGCVMALVFSVGSLFLSNQTMQSLFQTPIAGEMILRVFPFAIGMVLSMCCTTCVSLSMEGKNLWIIKSLPIEESLIVKSKILMNLTLQIPVGVICAVILNLRFPFTLPMRILTFLTPVVCCLFSSVSGMLINLKMPNYEWTSETALVKQSLPAMAGIMGGMVSGLLPIGILLLLGKVDAALLNGILTLIAAIGMLLLWNVVKHQKI